MKTVFLAEARLGIEFDDVSVVGIFATLLKAKRAVEVHAQDRIGLVTALTVGESYSEGIGLARHWHYSKRRWATALV